jgi:hypothetical protein
VCNEFESVEASVVKHEVRASEDEELVRPVSRLSMISGSEIVTCDVTKQLQFLRGNRVLRGLRGAADSGDFGERSLDFWATEQALRLCGCLGESVNLYLYPAVARVCGCLSSAWNRAYPKKGKSELKPYRMVH